MKKTTYLLAFIVGLISFACQNENLIPEDMDELQNPILKSAIEDTNNPLEQFIGVPVAISLLQKGGTAHHLGVIPNSLNIGVVPLNSGDKHQQWILEKRTDLNSKQPFRNNAYYIKLIDYPNLPSGFPEYNRDRRVLSNGFDIKVDLYEEKHYKVAPQFCSWFIIKDTTNINGHMIYKCQSQPNDKSIWPINEHTLFLAAKGCMKNDNVIVGLRNRNTDPNLYIWQIQPIEKYKLEKIEYYYSPENTITQIPDFITFANVDNSTSIQQEMSMTFSNKATESSKFSETEGVSVSMTSGASFGVPSVGIGSSIDYTTVSSSSWSFENSESKEDSRSYSFTIKVAPYTRVYAEASVQRYEMKVTYLATFKGESSGKTIKLSGHWEGVRASTINYALKEYPSGKILKSFSGIPKSPIDLTK